MRHLALALLLLTTACTDPFATAQQADSVESYSPFLEQQPTSPYRTQAKIRLEELVLEQARSEKSLAAYDVYLERFPKGVHIKKAKEERRQHLFDWADGEATPEGWQTFLDEYPSGNKKMAQKARKRLRMTQNREAVTLTPPEMEKVNLAEDPDGPLNGWGFYVDVTNNSDKAITYLMLEISYLNAAGKAIDRQIWPVVAKRLPGNLPMDPAFKKPLLPGKSRTWDWSTGDMPAGWAKKVRVAPVDIRFAGEDD